MKGIILAGGSGTRLYPLTQVVSKQLLPVYDKPMIYYPLAVLMQAEITDILIISTPSDLPRFKELLGDGSRLGISLTYKVQHNPDGLAQAFIIGKDFIGVDSVCLILGDNIFYGHGLEELLKTAKHDTENNNIATVFGYGVNDPERYGVIEFDKKQQVISIEEKPINPKSNYAVTGLYFYPNDVINIAQTIKPSARGELEITDVNNSFLYEKRLNVQLLSSGYAWLDTGTHENMLEASQFISIIERRQGLKVACIEEIAYRKGYIDTQQLMNNAEKMLKNQYGQYLQKIINE